MTQVAIALGFGAEAWRRILAGAERRVVAELLGQLLSVVPEWVDFGFLEGEPKLSLS